MDDCLSSISFTSEDSNNPNKAFLPKHIEFIQDKLQKTENQQNNEKSRIFLNSFESLLEKVIASQRTSKNISIPIFLENLFYQTLKEDLLIQVIPSHISSDCFSVFFLENAAIKKNHYQLFQNAITQMNHEKPKTLPNEENLTNNIILFPFEEILDYIDVLSPNDIEKYLIQIIDFLNKFPSEYNLSNIISLFHFATKISQIPKFQLPEIQSNIIYLLIKIGSFDSNIIIFIYALIIMTSLPPSFIFSQTLPNISLNQTKKVSDFEFKFNHTLDEQTTIFDYAKSEENFFILTNANQILCFNKSKHPSYFKKFNISIELKSPLLTIQSEYIFIISGGKDKILIVGNVNDNALSRNTYTLPIDFYPVLAFSSYNDELYIAQQLFDHFIRISVISNLTSFISKYRKTEFLEENIHYSYLTFINPIKFVFFKESMIFLVSENNTLESYQLQKNGNPFGYIKHPFYFWDSIQFPFHVDKELLISMQIYHQQLVLKSYHFSSYHSTTFHFSPFPLDIDQKSNCNRDSLVTLLSRLTSHIDFAFHEIGENFDFVDSLFSFLEDQVISFSITLINQALISSFDDQIRHLIISFCLKIIALKLSKFNNKFSLNPEEYQQQFKPILQIIERVLFSDIAQKSQQIMESFITVIFFGFHQLFYPDYDIFISLVKKILSNSVLSCFFFQNIKSLYNHPSIIYLFSIDSCLSYFHTDFHRILRNGMNLLYEELEYLESYNLKRNSCYIISYLKCYLSEIRNLLEQGKIEFANQFLRILMVNITNIYSFPQISYTFAKYGLEILYYIYSIKNSIYPIFPSSDHEDMHEMAFDQFSIAELHQIIESPHNYSNKSSLSWEINWKNVPFIHLEFDSRCRTEANCDILSIYDTSKSSHDALFMQISGNSSNWPQTLDLPFSNVRFEFNSDESINYWGFKITATANHIEPKRDFQLKPNLFFFNYFAFLIGKAINMELISNEYFEIEEKQYELFSSGLLLQTYDFQNSTFIENSHDIIYDLNNFTDRGQILFNSIGRNGKTIWKKVVNPEVESKILASLIKTMNLQHQAEEYLQSLKNNEKENIHDSTLKLLWKAAEKIRIDLRHAKQVSINSKDKSQENGVDFDSYMEEILLKVQYLLSNKNKFIFQQSNITNTISLLTNFIISKIPLSHLLKIQKDRESRISIRIAALQHISFILLNSSLELTSEYSLLQQFVDNLSIITNPKDLEGISLDLKSNFICEFQEIISSILHFMKPNLNPYLKTILFRAISMPIYKIVQKDFIILTISSIIKEKLNNPSILFSDFSSYWKLIAIWSIKTPLSFEDFINLSSLINNEPSRYNSYILLSVLPFLHTKVDQFHTTLIQDLLKIIPESTPRMISAVFILLSRIFSTFNVSQEIFSIGTLFKGTLSDLIAFLITIIGEIISGNGCKLLVKNSITESNIIVVSSLISFIRILLSESSIVRDFVTEKLHFIFNHLLPLNNEVVSVFQAIGIFTVLGQEILPFISGGYGIELSNKNKPIPFYIYSFDIYNQQFFTNSLDPKDESFQYNITNPISSSRIQSNPNYFHLLNEEANIIKSLLEISFEDNITFNNNISINDNITYIENKILYSVFKVSFFSFLYVLFQNYNNAKILVNNHCINPQLIIDLASRKSQEISETNIHETIGLGGMIHRFSTDVYRHSLLSKFNCKNLQEIKSISDAQTMILIPLVNGHSSRLSKNKEESMNNIIKTENEDQCVFIGNSCLSSSSIFYYEIKIIQKSECKFQIGFIDGQTTESTFFGFDFYQNIPISPFLKNPNRENISLSNGDTIGCGYTKNKIIFFINGKELSSFIPNIHIDKYTPTVITHEKISFEVNFGESPFITNINENPHFAFSLEDQQVSTLNVQASSNNNQPNFSNETYPNNFKFNEASSEKNQQNPSYQLCQRQNIDYGMFFVGETVVLERRTLNHKSAKNSSFSNLPLEFFMNYYHKFGIIKKIENKSTTILKIDIIDPGTDSIVSLDIDSRFVDTISQPLNNFAENYSTLYINTIDTPFANCYKLKQLQDIQKRIPLIANNIITHISRYMIILFYEANKTFLRKPLPNYDSIFPFIILEIIPFSSHPNIFLNKVPTLKLNELLFNEPKCNNINYSSTNNFCYLIFGDTYSFKKIITIQLSKDEELSLSLLNLSLSKISNLHNSSNDIYEMCPQYLQFETWHPQPLTIISKTFIIPNCQGFIPIIHSDQLIAKFQPNSLKYLKNPTLNDCLVINGLRIDDPIADSGFIQGNHLDIQLEAPSSSDKYGAKFSFLPIPSFLTESLFNTSLGGFHILFYILSVIISNKLQRSHELHFLKTQLIKVIFQSIQSNNFFVTIFSFNLISPILNQLQWNPGEITPELEGILSNLASPYISKISWSPIINHKQEAIILQVYVQQLILDNYSAKAVQEGSINSIENLYDQFILKASKPTDIFHSIVHAFSICSALSQQNSAHFPSYLIAESWAEGIEYSFDFTSPRPLLKPIFHHTYGTFKQCQIILDSESYFSKDCLFEVTWEDQLLSNRIILHPGESAIVSNSFTTTIIDPDTSSPAIRFNECWFHLRIISTPTTLSDKRTSFAKNYKLFTEHCNFMATQWTVSMDESLRMILHQNPLLLRQTPLHLPDDIIAEHPCLRQVSPQLIHCRFNLFEQLDSMFNDISQIVSLGKTGSVLGDLFNSCRSAISTELKISSIQPLVFSNMNTQSAQISIRFDRFKANAFRSSNGKSGESIIQQLISQVPMEEIDQLKRNAVPWHVELVGEGATDVGGPGRDLFTEACMEIMHPSLNLFIQAPNHLISKLIPNSDSAFNNTASAKLLYYYAGVLMSCCHISKLPEPMRFSGIVWKALTSRKIKIEDIYEIDDSFKEFIKTLEDSNQEKFEEIAPCFACNDSRGEKVEMFPGGAEIRIPFERRDEFVRFCKKMRIKEFNKPLEFLRDGFGRFFPLSAAEILSPWELELIVCGDEQVPIADLKRLCIFPKRDEEANMLWRVLESFSPHERLLFIKFACGRMGLPPPGSSWGTCIKIMFKSSSKPDPVKPLPVSATCMSEITIPRYQSEEWMAKKIRTAIIFGADIDLDHQAQIGDVSQFT